MAIGILVSGPAGAGKSQRAREILRLWRAEGVRGVLADFQSIYAAISGDVRGPDGRYPLRDDRLLSLTEYIRSTLVRSAAERDFPVVMTNSDGTDERRRELLRRLGAGANEQIIDPGESVVRAALADPWSGELSPQCNAAVMRWYRAVHKQRQGIT